VRLLSGDRPDHPWRPPGGLDGIDRRTVEPIGHAPELGLRRAYVETHARRCPYLPATMPWPGLTQAPATTATL
jgi:hypothetical protein